MEERFYNTTQVAKRVGVSDTTIKDYAKYLDIPHFKNDRGHNQFTSEMLQVFKRVKAMRDSNLDYETIALNLKAEIEKARNSIPEPEANGLDLTMVHNAVVERLRDEFGETHRLLLEKFITVSQEEYGKTKEELGIFKGRMQMALQELHELKEGQKLLPAHAESLRDAQEFGRVAKADAERLANDLESLRNEAQGLRSQVEKLSSEKASLSASRDALKESVERLQDMDAENRERFLELSRENGELKGTIALKDRDIERLTEELERERSKGLFGFKKK